MIESDTIKLLKECDAGVKMGTSSIEDVLDDVKNEEFVKLLSKCKDEHLKLDSEISELLGKYHDDGKEPNPMAKGMSWLKTNTKLYFNESDNTVSDLITDGCNMGVKSLHRYLNQYDAADEKSKNLTNELIAVETELANEISPFL